VRKTLFFPYHPEMSEPVMVLTWRIGANRPFHTLTWSDSMRLFLIFGFFFYSASEHRLSVNLQLPTILGSNFAHRLEEEFDSV